MSRHRRLRSSWCTTCMAERVERGETCRSCREACRAILAGCTQAQRPLELVPRLRHRRYPPLA